MKKLTAHDPETQSADLIADNLQQLKALFPEACTEGKIDFEVLKQLLGGAVEEREEKYGLNWHGKRRARQLALTPSTGTLRPCPEDSVDWDTTGNLMIEGDNLEVLKLLQKSYAGKVKLIYIDPPYNTGKDFVYPDDYRDNISNYLKLTGQVEGGQKISSNTEASGRFHTDWLSMMYPRLKLARNLLRDDGVIFISIDDNEVANLQKIMDEIFGNENHIGTMIWDLPRGINAALIARSHEYILAYGKFKELLKHFNRDADQSTQSIERCNKNVDIRHPASEIKFKAGLRYEGKDQILRGRIEGNEWVDIIGELEFKDGKLAKDVTLKAGWTMRDMIINWMDGKEIFDLKGQKITEFFFKENGKLYSRKEMEVQSVKSVLKKMPDTQIGREEIISLFKKDYFSYAKPSGLIKYLCSLVTKKDDLVLDFFAGSCTMAHAVFELSREDSGNRRFIMVQLPEPTPEDSVACQAGYNTIADIGKERIRRAAKKIKDENPLFAGDTGFRVFKLDSSNIRAWEPDRDNLPQSLLDATDHLKADRSEQDILFELLLKLGLDLTIPIEQKTIAGKTVHSIGAGVLLVCLAPQIAAAEVEPLALGLVDWHKELAPVGDSQLVFRDSAFADDVAKTNLTAILQQHGLENVRSL